jgi:enoyl-[acyl-carrier protein] reductase II
MIRTALCDLLGIDVPIIQAGMSVFTSAELAAATSNAGGLGTLGGWRRPTDDLARQIEAIDELTTKPYAINHLAPDFNEESFALTLAAKPAVVSLALGDPGDLVARIHDVGSLVLHQVTTVQQAYEAAERGVDVILAQGGEAGGYGGVIASMPLIPQVVDAVSPIPVVASGGIADGRGIAAALVLGASGVNIGTRFLASAEAPIDDAWKQLIASAKSEDAVKFDALNDISPTPGTVGYGTSVRALRTAFIDNWNAHREEAAREAERLGGELRAAGQAGQLHTLMPGAGQSAGLINSVLPVSEIMRQLVAEADAALARYA